ncbi:retrovirus-related pol polyprotein from transposon TNT 1-94 [Tanacetum coccineum]
MNSLRGRLLAQFIESIKEDVHGSRYLTSGEIVSLNLLSRTRKLGHSTMELQLRDVAVYYHFAISTFPVKIVIKSSAFILEYLLQLPISIVHTTTDHNDIEWFRKGEELQERKAKALKSTKAESSNANRSKSPTRSYLHKYLEQSGPNVVFGDDSTCTTEGYDSIKCNGIVFTKVAFLNGLKYNLISISQLCDAKYIVKFNEKRGTIFNSNKEVVMITPRDKPCSSCEKGKHHRASFKTKQTSSIKKCLHLLYMDLFGPVTPKSINHEKYTLVIVDEYSRNSILVNICDEKRISQNFSYPYTPEQNGVAEKKNRTLIQAARTMLSRSVFPKQYWTEAVATACYTQNISTIVKRHLKTPYEIFRKRIPNINFLHVFGFPVYIHNHKDHLGKFDEKDDDGYLLGYSLVSKSFRVFNTR